MNRDSDTGIIFVIPIIIPLILFFGLTFFAQEIALNIINVFIDFSWIALILIIAGCFIFCYLANDYDNKIQKIVFGTLFSITSSLKITLFFAGFLPSVYTFADSDLLNRLIGIFVMIIVFMIVFLFTIPFVALIMLLCTFIDDSLNYISLKLTLVFMLDLVLTAISYLFIRGLCIHFYEENFIKYLGDSIYSYILFLN